VVVDEEDGAPDVAERLASGPPIGAPLPDVLLKGTGAAAAFHEGASVDSAPLPPLDSPSDAGPLSEEAPVPRREPDPGVATPENIGAEPRDDLWSEQEVPASDVPPVVPTDGMPPSQNPADLPALDDAPRHRFRVLALALGVILVGAGVGVGIAAYRHNDKSPKSATATTHVVVPPVTASTRADEPTTAAPLGTPATAANSSTTTTTAAAAVKATTTTTHTTTTAVACPTGSVSSTIANSDTQDASGNFTVTGSGTVTNSTTTNIEDVVVNWTVTYQNGSTVATSTPVNGGAALSRGGSAAWSAPASGNQGTNPPVQIAVNSVSFKYVSAPANCPT
jgi:hypothetical protein